MDSNFKLLSLYCCYSIINHLIYTAMEEKTYIGTYKVVKIFRKSNRREVIERGLTRDEAKRLVNSFPNNNRSMVVFMKQFTSDKYYV